MTIRSRFRHAPAWHNPTAHGLLFHPVKVKAATSGREFKHFNCAKQFDKELAANARLKNGGRRDSDSDRTGGGASV